MENNSRERLGELLSEIEVYQDVLINGSLLRKGKRSCDDRYECIKNFIKPHEGRFTVLDIGANLGFYSLKIAQDFPSSFVVMVQPRKEGKALREICELNTSTNKRLLLLDCLLDLDKISKLSGCEHFDYILCNNVLHHFGPDWQKMYENIKKMCKYLIAETPPPEDRGSSGQEYLLNIHNALNQEASLISEEKFQRHTDEAAHSRFYFFEFSDVSRKPFPYYNFPIEQLRTHSVSYEHVYEDGKRFFRKGSSANKEKLKYIHGVNLFTFLSLNGTFPPKETLLDKVSKEKISTDYKWDNTHSDIFLWNFILNENLNLIDFTSWDSDFLERGWKNDDDYLDIVKDNIKKNKVIDFPSHPPNSYLESFKTSSAGSKIHTPNKEVKTIAAVFSGGLGDHLANNRFIPAIKDKFPNAEITAFSVDAKDYPVECLKKLYGSFYKKIKHIKERKYKKCLVEDSQGGIAPYQSHFLNCKEEDLKELRTFDRVYDFDTKQTMWGNKRFDFNWYRYFNFFPKPDFEGTLPPDEEYIVFHLNSGLSPTSLNKLDKEYAENLLKLFDRTDIKCFVIDDLSEDNLYEWSVKYENVEIISGTIKEISSLISNARVYIGADSGLKCLAFAYGVPCLILYKFCSEFGTPPPQSYFQWLPWAHYVYPINTPPESILATADVIFREKIIGHYPFPSLEAPKDRLDHLALRMRDSKIINDDLS
jgi:SAM-dependent methyltransferase